MKVMTLREETLWWLHKVDQQIRDYSDKIGLLQTDNDVMFRYYMRKLERASKELEIPIVTMSDQDDIENMVDTFYAHKHLYDEVRGIKRTNKSDI